MKKYWIYIKCGLVILLLVFIIFDMRKDSISQARIESVTKHVVKAAKFQGIEPAENRMIKRFYGLNPQDYAGVVLYAPADNMDVHELLIVKLKDTSQKDMVEDAIEERLDTQLTSFEGYGAEQTALLKKHVLVSKGNYVFYMVGENVDNARKAFVDNL